jgi:hypothetical protein
MSNYKVGYISLPSKKVLELCEKARKEMELTYEKRIEELIEAKRNRWLLPKLTREQAIASMAPIANMEYFCFSAYKSNDQYVACQNLEEVAKDIGVFGHIQLSVTFYCELKRWVEQKTVTTK